MAFAALAYEVLRPTLPEQQGSNLNTKRAAT
jgi:hypothetical protein